MPHSSTKTAPRTAPTGPQSGLSAAPVNLFAGVLNTTPVKVFSLAEALALIQNGTYRPQVQRLQHIRATEGEARYKVEKAQLDAVTFCGTFTTRNKVSLAQHSGIVHGDLDHLVDVPAVKAQLCADPCTVYCFASPSGSGLKVGLHVAIVPDDTAYKVAWQAAADSHHRQYGIFWDTSGKDVSRLCFVSDDPDLHFNPDAVRFLVPDAVPVSPPRPTHRPVPPALTLDDSTLLDKAMHASDGPKFTALWGGDSSGYASQSEADEALCCLLTFWAQRDPARVDSLFRQSGLYPTIDRKADPEDYLQRTITAAIATVTNSYTPAAQLHVSRNGPTPAPPTSTTGTVATPAFFVIELTPGVDIKATVDTAQQAILALPDPPRLYQRGRMLCRIAHGVTPPAWLRRPLDAPVIVGANGPYLRELAQQAATWWNWDARAKKWKPAHPPQWCIETLQDRQDWPFPPLEGMLTAPTLRPDGSVLDTPGYDPSTGLYLDTHGVTFPPVPTHPTMDEARSALGTLQEALQDFAFLDVEVPGRQDRYHYPYAAALAAVLTLACRGAIVGNVPLFGVTSTVRGSGKGLLIDVLSIIGTGRPAPRWPQSDDNAEDRKRLLTVAMAGDPCVHIDNVLYPLGSPALDLALTAPSVTDRILGRNVEVEAPLNMVWFASGNNLQYNGDLARRVVPLPLDPQREKPEERTDFTHNPLLPWVQAHRPRLLIAALTILKAYFVTGCEKQGLSAFGSFQEWSDLMRSALVWAGEQDCCQGRQTLEAESDPQYEALATLLDCWQVCYPIDTTTHVWPDVTLRQMLDAVNTHAQHVGPGATANEWNDLWDALGALIPRYDGKTLHSPAISYKLRTWQGRVVGTKRLVRAGKHNQGIAWRVETL